MLEILEQRHDWAKFNMTWDLLKYVLFTLIPEVLVHSQHQDEEQVRHEVAVSRVTWARLRREEGLALASARWRLRQTESAARGEGTSHCGAGKMEAGGRGCPTAVHSQA